MSLEDLARSAGECAAFIEAHPDCIKDPERRQAIFDSYRSEAKSIRDSDVALVLEVPFTFSRWCISGLVPDCQCRRCLERHGEPWDETTERAAEERSKIESEAFRRRMRESIIGEGKS